MTLFVQRLVDGLEYGCIYAALALAIVLVFRGSGLLNFAQGELAMVSTYVTWSLVQAGLPLVVAIVLSMAGSFGAGAMIERWLIRPVAARSHDHLPLVIVTIGLLLALNSLAQVIWGTDGASLSSLFGEGSATVHHIRISRPTVGTLAVLIVVATALRTLLHHTRIGLSMRAVATNQSASSLVGIRVGRVLMLSWGLAAALGALAGALIAPTVSGFDNNLMQGVLVLAFAAATLGGFDSLVGAIVGGLVVGILESLAAGYLASDLKLIVPFVVILGVLLVRPTGLFGSVRVVRV